MKSPKHWPHAAGPLSVINDHSRYGVSLTATGKLDGDLVRRQLERIFDSCELPETVQMDHDRP